MREMEASVGRMEASMGRTEERLGVTTNDANLLIPASATHTAKLGRVPGLVASDAAFYFGGNETGGESNGRQTRGSQRSSEREQRRNGQKCRTGCEGRVSVANADTGSIAVGKNAVGMQRWVWPGAISDNLPNIGRAPAFSRFDSPAVIPAGFDLLCAVDQRLETINFALASC
jgi:hypothetical protein